MIKGKSTIQLFDGSTGKEIYAAHDTNMVTNALENILNPPIECMFAGADLRTVYQNITPIYKIALGGIMLWQDYIPESAEQILPPEGAVEVAHAGGAYTGNDLMRGSYNATESGVIENGYRHVWDFGTERGNCSFSAITLTSLVGGQTGWSGHADMAPFFDSPARFKNTNYQNSYITGLETVSADSNLTFIGRFRKNVYTFLKYESGGVIFTDITTQDISKIGVLTNFSTISSQNKVSSVKVAGTFCRTVNNAFVTADGLVMFVYNLGSNKTLVTFIDPITKEITEQKTLTLDANYSDTNCVAYYKGNYYMSKPVSGAWRLCKITADGQVIVTSRAGGSGAMYILEGRLFAPEGIYVYITTDGESFTQIMSPFPAASNPFVYDYDRKLPYVLFAYNGSTMLIKNYLATINNLSAPVTKTNQQTMKITYEIYNA